ncbi:hypothetical protein GUJ93_ZPchr0013g36105 [Zizania palustris]|uniref:Uncharacterized protein n=1 Tax=Zizania palustris TaxID=103762 RepID=A0A8J5WZV4_ZIZPA|nr:hypothetical protein GUJ93_ZPchr0013g36105 [Zizania palustris]
MHPPVASRVPTADAHVPPAALGSHRAREREDARPGHATSPSSVSSIARGGPGPRGSMLRARVAVAVAGGRASASGCWVGARPLVVARAALSCHGPARARVADASWLVDRSSPCERGACGSE